MAKCITCKQDKPFTVLSKTYPQCEDCYNLMNPSKWDQIQNKNKQRSPSTYSQPFYAVNHVNLACVGIPVKKCPCDHSWLCDGIWGNKQSMSSPYDTAQQELRKENFGEN